MIVSYVANAITLHVNCVVSYTYRFSLMAGNIKAGHRHVQCSFSISLHNDEPPF